MTEMFPSAVGGPSEANVACDEGAELLRRHLAGEAGAFAALLELYRAPIYGFFVRTGVPRDVADDLFQETFLRVHQHGRGFIQGRSFRTWLFTIAHNLLKSHHRKRMVRRILVDWWAGPPGEERAFDPPSRDPGPADTLLSHETLRWVEVALGKLGEGPRSALVLTQIEGLKLTEAADVLGVPVATVKTWVHRGRKELAQARRALGGGAT
jgi:RNA polymerase sigma-70 factor (ECF subfamily)